MTKKQDEEHVAFEQISPEEEAALARKLDRVLMPLMAFVYFFQYLDKQSINYGSVFGLRKDLHLTGQDFSWIISLFYFGQLCSEYPAAYLMGRLPITLFVGITIIAWGAVGMTLGATHDFAGLAAARFFLGFAEGAVSPAFIIITSNWYRRREHPIRVATWVSMSGVSQVLGALMMYGIGGASAMVLEKWRVMFLTSGGLTAACGVAFCVLMPRDTTTAWFLNKREREIATRRLALDRGTRDRAQPVTWLYFTMALCITLTTPILKFSSLVINGFGYSPFTTMLVGLPGGAISFIMIWASALIPRFLPGTRIYTSIGLSLVPLLGSAMLLALPLHGAECALLSSTASMMASNVKGNTKKSVVSAGFFIVYCVGCIVSPQAWTERDAPRYTKGCILLIASWVGLIVTYAVYGVVLRRGNARTDRLAAEGRYEYDVGGHDGGEQAVQMGVAVDSD
ncbi:major facilitator superfamily domain-containing protein [Colletotrichum phormii]|uniref:Major facilitator superfamily domain-containing protein n=1 Tax=Colletotrichum phormii TaxID=359342 RepID=A0AAI9ZLK9_9PEZI|nr:major facilitator superfamily domain-containing protein [Colletotrichum phormii]KAK1625536.1 major facilitator superfamily domain-containing protein [Colletotrichum phormii]